MQEKDWRVYAKKADFEGLARELGISPYTVRIMRNRGLTDFEEMAAYLEAEESRLNNPWMLKDMKTAVRILQRKIATGKKIRVIGDYDIDGVCSIAVLYQGLALAGARVEWRIPHRIKDGYGLNLHMVEDAIESGVDTIVTCDNGIAARAEISYAKAAGLTVIVTDHHDVPQEGVPEADAVINPKQEDCSYPFKGLCGAVVAWKLVIALFETLMISYENAQAMLEYCAMATIGDVMDLQGENRLIVKLGLERLHRTSIKGIVALAKASELELSNIQSYHIGFILGPALNAGGRLETAELAARLLLTKDEAEAEYLAIELKELNDKRKNMTLEGVEQAKLLAQTAEYQADRVLVLYLPECHESLAGIIAGRIRELYYKPCIILTKAADGGVKGSGRSIEGYHMFQELQKASDLLGKFGGHPMAAGLSLQEENVEALRRRLNENCMLTLEQLTQQIWIDIALPMEYVTAEWIRELERLEPFGKGNEKPVFADRNLSVKRAMIVGKSKKVLKLYFKTESGHTVSAVYFGDVDEFLEDVVGNYGEQARDAMLMGMRSPIRMSVLYYPDLNEFRGEVTVQAVVKDYRFQIASKTE